MNQKRNKCPGKANYETILVVEDMASVRLLVTRILSLLGYNVLEADNGAQGLIVSRNYAKEIHLLITDFDMPLMNGRQLADNLMQERPDMRILFISGRLDTSLQEFISSKNGVDFLQKPFTSKTLRYRVEELLMRVES